MVRGALVVLLWLPSALAFAQLPAFTTALTLTGQVVAASDGAPLRRARVDVSAATLHLGSVLTDDSGRFALEATGGGPFTLTVGKGGYAFARTRLSRAEASVPLVVRLPPGAAVAGRVLDQQGAPAYRSTVAARRIDPEAPGFPQYFSTTTDDVGAFRLSGLPSGRFEVSAGPPGASGPVVITASGSIEPAPDVVQNERIRELNARLSGATVIDAAPLEAPPVVTVVQSASGPVARVTPASPPPRETVTVASGEEVSVDLVVIHSPRIIDQVLGGPADAPLPAGRAATIRGRVMTYTGQPVSGAEVRLSGVAGIRSSLPALGQRVTTDADGRYLLRGMPPGVYLVEAQSPGYGTVAYGQQRARQPGRPIALATDQTVDGINIMLPRMGTISGVVLDENGEPLQGASMQALQLRDADGSRVASPVSQPRRTDDRGRYRLFGFLPGTYIVATSVDAVAASTNARERSGYAPIFFPGTTVVDAATRLELDGDASAVNLVFTRQRAAHVRGVALDSEGPLIGGTARILVSRRSGAIALEFPPSTLRGDGTFVFPNMPTGDYVVQVRGNGPGRTGLFGHEYVSVTDADPAPLRVRTSRGATLEGRFVIDGEPEPTFCVQAALPGTTVNASCRAQTPPFTVSPVALDPDRARPDGGGSMVVSSEYTFYVSGLFGPTAFRLRQAPSDSWFLKAVTIGGVDVTDTGFDPGAGPPVTGDAQIVVAKNGATISGRVTDRDVPVVEYSVVVFPVFRDQWTPYSRRLRFATSGTDGMFRTAGLPPGDYFVAAVDRVDGTTEAGEWQNADVLGRLLPGAERVTVREGETRVTTLRLIRR